METGKPGLASAPVHINSVAAQTEKRMDIQAPLTAVYIHTVPALPAQPYPQPPAAAREPATLHLAMPPLYSKETLPFLTLHIAGGLQSQPGLSLAAASPAARPKSAGKHVCPHCGRDCMKPSVLEKHLRCHTGERPYPCTTCGISFKTQSNLYKHKRTQAHARLSSESEQSSLGSQESMSSSRETCTSSLSLDERSQEEKEVRLPAAEITCPVSATKVGSVKTQGSVGEQDESTPTETKEHNESGRGTTEGGKQTTEKSSEKPQLTASRHLPLQRQEATLFSNQWESSVARGKSQSHESTDSGFSESSDHNPSPGSILPDHSMDSLTESTKEHLEETTVNTQTPSDSGQGGQEAKDTAKEQEHKSLEERISKLISENSAVVEDKKLEHVRPRKTVLSKQGSIDLPMPYTYKDSFHFDMRISKTPTVGLQRNKKPGFYSSVPTQHSTTMEHAPLTRSNSLPFSVTLLQPERSSPTSSYQSDYDTLVRRGSSGQINPTGFAIKPVNQQSSTHRPLVRQTAVDCNHATDGLFMNSSVEEAGTGSLSCDGDGGDICGEPSNRKFRRKKAQKFAYNKWYMYGGGTFKKLYSAEKGGDDKGRKCMTNPEHEAVQGLQKRSSEVHKESVATTTSTVIFTSSSATVYHRDCPPAKLSVVSAVDFKTSQLHTPGSSLKSPLRRNLSLSILPLPLIGSLVGHKTDSMSRGEDKHTDSSSQLCGANIPSNRKKPKTDDKIICPLEMETDPNTMTHPLPSVTGSDTNLSYINLQKNVKHTQLKGALFPPCIINANTPSVSTSPATSTPSAAKTSFLPKYQLKLPNTAEPDSNPSPQVVDKPSGTDGCNFTSALSSSLAEQTPISVATCQKQCTDPVTSPLTQSCDIKKTFSSIQGQLLSPFTAATLRQAETLNKNVTSTLAVVHRQSAGTTVTTTCLQGYQGGLCSTSIQPSKTAPVQVPRPVAPVVANFPATPTTAIRHQTPAATVTAFSPHPKSPLSHTQLLPAPVNRAHASSNTPIVPCHVVPFDQMQPAAQNVFHVHTADLQICLQIISDEQLALIEPQIERPAGSNVSQRDDAEGVQQNKAQSFVTNEGSDQQQLRHQKEPDQSENLPALNMERIKSPVSVQFGKAEPNLHSNSPQAAVSVEAKPPEALGLSRRPHKHGHINMVAAAQSSMANVMSSAASLKGVKSGSQTSDEERALPLNHRAEKQLLPDQRVSQGGAVSQTLSGQHKLSMASLSSSTVNQNNTRIEESQHKHKNQGAACNVGTVNTKSEASAHKSTKSESEEAHPPLQVGLLQASSAVCADGLSSSASSFFINKCEAPTQASIYCSNPVESTSSEVLNSSKHADTGYNTVNPMDSSAQSQETSPSGSRDITSTHSEKPPAPFTSVSSCIQVERPKDIPAVLTSIQSPSAGLIEGDSLAACEAQKEPQTQGCGATPGQPDGTNWRPQQSQEPGETNHCCTEGQSGGEDKNEGIETDEEPGQWSKDETNSRYTCLQDIIKPEGEDRKANADSLKNSWLSEQHLQHLSQTHSGMSESPQQSPQQTPSMSNNLNLPASSNSQTVLFNSPQPPSEMNSFYFSQHWESSSSSSSIHSQQTHVSCEANASQHIRAQAHIRETIESGPQQTFSHQVQKQSDFSPSVQQGTAVTAGNNVTAVSCCSKLTSGSNRSLVPDVKTASSTHPSQVSYSAQASRATAGSSLDAQASHNTVLDSNPFTYPQPVDYQDTKDKAPNDYMSQSSNSGRPDIINKYQSFLFAGPLHGYQPADCLTSGPIRPVQNCQDNAEDTSSSDDEGKLIIEL